MSIYRLTGSRELRHYAKRALTPRSLNVKLGSHFQPGEGPSRGLLRDYEPSDANRMQLFEAVGPGRRCGIVGLAGGARGAQLDIPNQARPADLF